MEENKGLEPNEKSLATNDVALAQSEKALDQIMKYLTKGPVLFLIGFFILTNVITVIFLVKVLLDSRNRENGLTQQTIDIIERRSTKISTEVSTKAVEEKIKPIEEKVIKTISTIDTNLVKLDSAINNR